MIKHNLYRAASWVVNECLKAIVLFSDRARMGKSRPRELVVYGFYYCSGKFIFSQPPTYRRKTIIPGTPAAIIESIEWDTLLSMFNRMANAEGLPISHCHYSKRPLYEAAGATNWTDFDSQVMHFICSVELTCIILHYGTTLLEKKLQLSRSGDDLLRTVMYIVERHRNE